METRAYAKINLTLEIMGLRPDGYHEVRTILQTIDLFDVLYFEPASRLEVDCSRPGLEGESNLVWKAATALRQATGWDKGMTISLEKRIPIGMGLGGGSSDAAATLNALNALWDLGLDDKEIHTIAATLGSDVPFFLRGGTAMGEGRGDVITQLPPLGQRWMVLACPTTPYSSDGEDTSDPSPNKTARLYSMLSPKDHTDGSHTRNTVDAFSKGEFSQGVCYNAFDRVASSAFPGLDQARQKLLSAGAGRVSLSGSGPALYAMVPSKRDGEKMLKSLKKTGLKGYCVCTVSSSPDLALPLGERAAQGSESSGTTDG